MDERRNDIGYKSTITILIGVTSIILSLFVSSTFSVANEGKNMSIENAKKITNLEANLIYMHDDLVEIKELLKRRIP